MQDKTLDMHILQIHSQALKHNVDIPDNLGTGQADNNNNNNNIQISRAP